MYIYTVSSYQTHFPNCLVGSVANTFPLKLYSYYKTTYIYLYILYISMQYVPLLNMVRQALRSSLIQVVYPPLRHQPVQSLNVHVHT